VAAIEGVDALGLPQLEGSLGLQRTEVGAGGIEGGIELAILLLGLGQGDRSPCLTCWLLPTATSTTLPLTWGAILVTTRVAMACGVSGILRSASRK